MSTTKQPRQTASEKRAAKAADKVAGRARRDSHIAELYQEGKSQSELADITGLSANQVHRILKEAHVLPTSADRFDPSRLLTAAEIRECRRENASSPQALAWLAGQRTDRRRNGHSMPALVTNADNHFEEEWDAGDEPM